MFYYDTNNYKKMLFSNNYNISYIMSIIIGKICYFTITVFVLYFLLSYFSIINHLKYIILKTAIGVGINVKNHRSVQNRM